MNNQNKPIIVGTKFFEHDSTVFMLDTAEKTVFAISTERVTRIKHDFNTIEPVIIEFPELFKKKRKYIFIHSFSDFSQKTDYCIETMAMSYFKFKLYRELVDIYKPKYIKDVKVIQDKYHTTKGKTDFAIDFFKKNKGRGSIDFVSSILGLKLVSNNERNNKKYIKKMMRETIGRHVKDFSVEFMDHHLCHAVSAYYLSPFHDKKSLVFTIDGHGDGSFSTLWEFEKSNYKKLADSKVYTFENKNGVMAIVSIGTLYTYFTEVLGFTPNSGEGKTEALAAYGKPNTRLRKQIEEVVKFNKYNLNWTFNKSKARKMFDIDNLKKIKDKVGDKNFAATIQKWLDDTIVEYLNEAYKRYPVPRLALSGGVAANIIMNLSIFERTPFKEMYIVPAMGDEGTAAGAAIMKAIDLGEDISWLSKRTMPYFGPACSKQEVDKELKRKVWDSKLKHRYVGNKWPEMAAEEVAKGKITAIFQGNMEFGPRALGNRSILADPRDKNTRDKINSTVKRRPYFQPFCPSVLEEERTRLFDKSYNHKHMAIGFRLKKELEEKLPSAIHIDGTARPQFVEETDNPNYYRLLKRFKELSGYGILINTSFNLHGRTIVRTAKDALQDFLDCNIDSMFIEGYMVERR